MAHIHSVYDTDKHFTIEIPSRLLQNQTPGKTSIMQYDHNSERVTFDMPAVIEGHKTLDCNVVQVHYLNIDAQTKKQNPGFYVVDDLQVSPESSDIAICSWLISRNATQLAGPLYFRVSFKCVTDKVDYSWSTAIYKGLTVADGIDNSDWAAEEYADILAQWEARITALEAGGATPEQIEAAVTKYLDENPVASGATAEQAAQIEQNKQDIENLSKDKLDASGLPEAINDALEQAKASGEFKGEPGDDYVLTDTDKTEIAEQAASMVEVPEGGTVTDEQIAEALENYLKENPVEAGAGSSIFYSSLSFEYNAGSILPVFNCYKEAIRNNGREVQVGDLIIFGNLSLGIVEEVTDTQVSGSLYASLKGESGSGGGLIITDDNKGNVTIESAGSVTITDDGNGNVTIV